MLSETKLGAGKDVFEERTHDRAFRCRTLLCDIFITLTNGQQHGSRPILPIFFLSMYILDFYFMSNCIINMIIIIIITINLVSFLKGDRAAPLLHPRYWIFVSCCWYVAKNPQLTNWGPTLFESQLRFESSVHSHAPDYLLWFKLTACIPTVEVTEGVMKETQLILASAASFIWCRGETVTHHVLK